MLAVITLLALGSLDAGAAGSPAIKRAADQILTHQTADGAIVEGTNPGQSSKLMPYFANFAALGLVSAYRQTHNPAYLKAAVRWADWYAGHQNPDGTVNDYDGTSGSWKSTGDYDSTDSYAATYLDLLLAISQAGHDRHWLQQKQHSIVKAVDAIRLTMQPVGLTLAKPTYAVMYTMDNTETAAGLRSGSALAAILGMTHESLAYLALANRMSAAVSTDLWDPATESYLIGLQPDGFRAKGYAVWYPDVMANLLAVAWLPSSERNRQLMGRLKAKFPETIPAAVNTEQDLENLAWWGWAAIGAHDHILLAQIQGKLAKFDVRLKSVSNAALLGHLCRILAGRQG